MRNLTNVNLLTLIFTSFTPIANNNILSGIKNKIISKAILVITDYKKIFKSIELDNVMAKSEKDLSSIALLPNGNIISASNDKALKLWNINDNNCIFLATEQFVTSLLILPDYKFACCSYQPNHINIWDMKVGSNPECVKSINTYEGCKFINKLFLLSNFNIACSARFDESFRILILDSKNEYNCIQNFLSYSDDKRSYQSTKKSNCFRV
jgi:WD40 repeat protein